MAEEFRIPRIGNCRRSIFTSSANVHGCRVPSRVRRNSVASRKLFLYLTLLIRRRRERFRS